MRVLSLFRFRLIPLITLCFVTLSAVTQIRLEDPRGHPLPGVLVIDGDRVCVSDSLGNVRLQPSGRTLIFTRIGLRELRLEPDALRPVVTLYPESIPLPGMNVSGQKQGPESGVRIDVRPEDNPLSAADLVDTVQGVRISPEASGERTVSLLGHRPRHTQIMIDGVPLNPAGGSVDISSIPASQIREIRLGEGVSAGGGSGAMGGTINLLTRQPESGEDICRLQLQSGFGSLGENHYRLDATWKHETLSLHAGLGYRFAENDDIYLYPFADPPEERTRKNNGVLSHHADFSLWWAPGTEQLHFLWFGEERKRQLPGRIGQEPQFDAFQMDTVFQRSSLRVTTGRFGGTSTLDCWLQNRRAFNDNTSSTQPTNRFLGRHVQQMTGSRLNHSGMLLDGLALTGGGQVQLETYRYDDLLNQTQSISTREMLSGAAWLEASWEKQWGVGGLRVQSRNRVDWMNRDEHSGEHLTSKIDVIAHTGSRFTWFGGAGTGQGFTVPSFYDLFWRGSSQTQGNPQLQPEVSTGYHLFGGVRHRMGESRFDFFRNDVDDLIYWHESVSGWKPDNIASARMTSWRVHTVLRPWDFLELEGWYQADEARDRSRNPDGSHGAAWDLQLIYVPVDQAGFTTRGSWRDWGLSVTWRRQGRQWPTRDHLWGALPSVETWDAALSWKLVQPGWSLNLRLRVDNLLDREFSRYLNDPAPGRTFLLTAGLGFETM